VADKPVPCQRQRYGASGFNANSQSRPPGTSTRAHSVNNAAVAPIPGTCWIKTVATDSFASVTDAPERSLTMIARIPVDLADVLLGEETPFCETLDRCKEVSLFLLDHAPGWLAES